MKMKNWQEKQFYKLANKVEELVQNTPGGRVLGIEKVAKIVAHWHSSTFARVLSEQELAEKLTEEVTTRPSLLFQKLA